jgi:ribonuclease-3
MDHAKLERVLGYWFKDVSLLDQALTHRSWTHENRPLAGSCEPEKDNESFEFLGDSVLGLAIAEHLFRKDPDSAEGDLTLMKHRLVSTTTLAKIAVDLGLGKFIKMGRGEERSGGREKSAIGANTVEAIIAAVFLDGGYFEARSFIVRILADELRGITPRASLDHKTTLQEKLQAQKLAAPSYNLIKSEGPPHERIFFVEAVWEGGRAEGMGRSLKSAEMKAAEAALTIITSTAVRGDAA